MSGRRLIADSRSRRRAREGSTAIEFAMVAFPFIFMMFAILEIGLVFVTDSVLANAAIEAGRMVRTGQADAQAMTAAQFKTEFCKRMSIFSSQCPARAYVDVREIPKFGGASPPDPTTGSTFDTSKTTCSRGSPGSIMLIRVWYQQPLFTPFMSQALSKMGDGNMLLMATTAFRNEPFTAVNPPAC